MTLGTEIHHTGPHRQPVDTKVASGTANLEKCAHGFEPESFGVDHPLPPLTGASGTRRGYLEMVRQESSRVRSQLARHKVPCLRTFMPTPGHGPRGATVSTNSFQEAARAFAAAQMSEAIASGPFVPPRCHFHVEPGSSSINRANTNPRPGWLYATSGFLDCVEFVHDKFCFNVLIIEAIEYINATGGAREEGML